MVVPTVDRANSCSISCDGWNTLIRSSYVISTGAGFCPSTALLEGKLRRLQPKTHRMTWAKIERHQRLFDFPARTHFVLKHGYLKNAIKLYDLTRAVAYLKLGDAESSGLAEQQWSCCAIGWVTHFCSLPLGLCEEEFSATFMTSSGGQRVRVGIARAIYGDSQRIFTTWWPRRSHRALVSFSFGITTSVSYMFEQMHCHFLLQYWYCMRWQVFRIM